MNHQIEKCNEDLLHLYYYRELDEDPRKRLECHLADCASCSESLRQLEQVLDSIPRSDAVMTNAEARRFTDRVIGQTRRRRRSPLAVWGGSLAAAAAALIVFLVTWNPGPTPLPQPGHGSRLTADVEVMQNYDMLQNLDLLENLDMLQQLESRG